MISISSGLSRSGIICCTACSVKYITADPGSAAAALGAAKTAFDLMKAFVDVRDATKVQAIKFELMGLLLEAQEAQAALIAEKRDLEERLRQMEAWDSEKERYQLVELAHGVFARLLKAERAGAEPIHPVCANCYQNRRISILQRHYYT